MTTLRTRAVAAVAAVALTVPLLATAGAAQGLPQLPDLGAPVLTDDSFQLPASATGTIDIFGNDEVDWMRDTFRVVDVPDGVNADVTYVEDTPRLLVDVDARFAGQQVEIVYAVESQYEWAAYPVTQATVTVDVLDDRVGAVGTPNFLGRAAHVVLTPEASTWTSGPIASVDEVVELSAAPVGLTRRVVTDGAWQRIEVTLNRGAVDGAVLTYPYGDVRYTVTSSNGSSAGKVRVAGSPEWLIGYDTPTARDDRVKIKPGVWHTIDVLANDTASPMDTVKIVKYSYDRRTDLDLQVTADRKIRARVGSKYAGTTVEVKYLLDGLGSAMTGGQQIGATLYLEVEQTKAAPIVRDDVVTMRKDGPRVIDVLRNDKVRGGQPIVRIPKTHLSGLPVYMAFGVDVKVTKAGKIRVKTDKRFLDHLIRIPYTVTNGAGHTSWGTLTIKRPLLARRDHVKIKRGTKRHIHVKRNDISSNGKKYSGVRLVGKRHKGIKATVNRTGRVTIKVGKRVKPGRYKVRYRLQIGKQRSTAAIVVDVRR